VRLYLVYRDVDDDYYQCLGRGVGEGGQSRGDGGEDRTEKRHYLQDSGQDGEGESILDVEGREAGPREGEDQDHRRDLADDPTGNPLLDEREDLLCPPPPRGREERKHPVHERPRVGDHVKRHHYGPHGLQEQTRPTGGYVVEFPCPLYYLLDGVGEVQARDPVPDAQGRVALGEVLEVILDAADHPGSPG
jgi:hypothetical protein